jgi:ergothioneine biosynthesis protein EgtB
MNHSAASRELDTGLENVQFLDLLIQYKRVRSRTTRICAPLEAEDAQIQSMPDVSPPKWHLAHTTWFFENFILRLAQKDYQVFHPRFHFIFNSYYKSQGAHHPRSQRGLLSRPTLAEVLAYRDHVDAQMFRVLSAGAGDPSLQMSWADLRERIILGLQHEAQHQELLLTDILHIFGCNPLRPAYAGTAPVFAEMPKRAEYVEFPGGLQRIGWEGEDFAFDNERPSHPVYLQPFRIMSCPVTNGEYLEFIEAGGYHQPRYWLSDGWDIVQREGWEAPLYWETEGDALPTHRFTFSGVQRIVENEPVSHLSYFEADAYARWKGARLPTEYEWEHAVRSRAIAMNGVGQTWEWTSSAYLPYPGFRTFTGDLGEYNGKFMSGQMVLRGGSIASPLGHIRHSYRNFFPPSARWQFTGVRLAQ